MPFTKQPTLDWSKLTDEEFIDFLNVFDSEKIQKTELRKELERRNWNFDQIISFNLDKGVTLRQNTIFKKKITYPSQVGYFYTREYRPVLTRMKNHPLLKGKKLVTYEDLYRQMILVDEWAEIIKPEELKDLTEEHVFIQLVFLDITFPGEEEIGPFLKNSIRVYFYLDPLRREYGPIEVKQI